MRRRVAEAPLHRDLSLIDSLTLNSSTGEAAQKVPGTYKKELHGLASGRWLEGQLSPRQKCGRVNCSFIESSFLPSYRCRLLLSLTLH